MPLHPLLHDIGGESWFRPNGAVERITQPTSAKLLEPEVRPTSGSSPKLAGSCFTVAQARELLEPGRAELRRREFSYRFAALVEMPAWARVLTLPPSHRWELW
jgi:hypothetical protein